MYWYACMSVATHNVTVSLKNPLLRHSHRSTLWTTCCKAPKSKLLLHPYTFAIIARHFFRSLHCCCCYVNMYRKLACKISKIKIQFLSTYYYFTLLIFMLSAAHFPHAKCHLCRNSLSIQTYTLHTNWASWWRLSWVGLLAVVGGCCWKARCCLFV